MAGAGGWAGGEGGHAGGHVRLQRLRNGVPAGEGTAVVEVRAGPRPAGVATPALPLSAPGARSRCPRPVPEPAPTRRTPGSAAPDGAGDEGPSGLQLALARRFPHTLLPIASFQLSGPGPGVLKWMATFIFPVRNHLGKACLSRCPMATFSQGEPR